ncbi:hypothetical protein R4172_18895 [Rhodococcus kroppenstedtii]|uniref:hypothetical protein n=1 Tax=Rhodococcoides kroppenstedtii TaxID=293050 RepID=UPI0029532EBD|nr:hypothetical protein [Rhodococcus kroppenstedtii]MDV7199614.1 hypothetical protein [Rhodococcus kroppenstedtii]
MEVEAESVAYVLAGILGLATATYSVGYVAGWANGDTDAVADTARAVLATVHELADALDPPRPNPAPTPPTRPRLPRPDRP